MRLRPGSEPGSVAYILARSSISMVALMAFIRRSHSSRAILSSSERAYRVMPPWPASPNLLKVSILLRILSRLQVYIDFFNLPFAFPSEKLFDTRRPCRTGGYGDNREVRAYAERKAHCFTAVSSMVMSASSCSVTKPLSAGLPQKLERIKTT